MKTTTKRVDKREKDIKKKLSAAILMLLVSCIMVVTSTYAWFTLSTAPEITGIQTTIGGNGNLEIALANDATWADPTQVKTHTSTSTATSATETNITWGNLIDVSEGYGVNLLNLAPAKLDYTDNTNKTLTTNYFKAPKYGSDGRVSELANVISGTYNGTAFTLSQDSNYGLRAFGISAAMTARQSGFMTYLSDITTNSELARTGTSTAMKNNGKVLGNMAVKLASSDDRSKVTFTKEEVASVKTLITDTQAAVAYIEKSIIAMVKAYVASAAMQDTGSSPDLLDDAEYQLVIATLESSDFNLSSFTLSGTNTVSFKYKESAEDTTGTAISINNDALYNIISKYQTIVNNLNSALGVINGLGDSETYTWDQIDDAVNYLMNMNGTITVSGKSMDELKTLVKEQNISALAPILTNLVVDLGAGSGVYYDISSLVGEVKASIFMDITYGSLSLTNQKATIKASASNPLLPAATKTMDSPSSAGAAEANIISDRYAFGMDLIFRTNAADSNLLLATNPVDRIYADNNNAETMGHGSTMTFESLVSTFTTTDMLKLIKNIKIVFVDENRNVLAHGAFDLRSTGVDEDGNPVPNYIVDEATGAITANIRIVDPADPTKFLEDGSTILADGKQSSNAQKICDLTQNQPKRVTVLVYLDGDTVKNKDVANSISSMKATMNLQFESSAELVPMEYSGLHIKGESTEQNP